MNNVEAKEEMIVVPISQFCSGGVGEALFDYCILLKLDQLYQMHKQEIKHFKYVEYRPKILTQLLT